MTDGKSEERATPFFLVAGSSYEHGCRQVRYFLQKTTLLKYDNIEFSPDRDWVATHPRFWQMLEVGLGKNRHSIKGLVAELEESGYSRLADLMDMDQGYESKILHILVHFLDGFIGIDSSFYNLVEDSHQLSAGLVEKIEKNPEQYRLLQISASSIWTFL